MAAHLDVKLIVMKEYKLLLLLSIVMQIQLHGNAQPKCLDIVDRLVQDNYPLEHVKQTPGFTSIFRDWGFVGNSLTSGAHEYLKEDGSKGYIDLFEYSWGQFICHATGANGVNFSRGGLTCRSWIDQIWSKAKEDPKQAYIIALGVNDRYKKYKIGDFTSDIDSINYEKNSDTFVGNYEGIIQRLKSIQPKAKIFVCTLYRKEDNEYNISIEQYNEVIRQMSKRFDNVYLIDLYKYAPINGNEFNDRYYNGGHNNAAGYLYSSWLLMTYIDWIIKNNFREFAEVALIGRGISMDR